MRATTSGFHLQQACHGRHVPLSLPHRRHQQRGKQRLVPLQMCKRCNETVKKYAHTQTRTRTHERQTRKSITRSTGETIDRTGGRMGQLYLDSACLEIFPGTTEANESIGARRLVILQSSVAQTGSTRFQISRPGHEPSLVPSSRCRIHEKQVERERKIFSRKFLPKPASVFLTIGIMYTQDVSTKASSLIHSARRKHRNTPAPRNARAKGEPRVRAPPRQRGRGSTGPLQNGVCVDLKGRNSLGICFPRQSRTFDYTRASSFGTAKYPDKPDLDALDAKGTRACCSGGVYSVDA